MLPDSPAEARYASGGSGTYKGSIDWFEWGTSGEAIPPAGTTKTNTREVAGGILATTCTITDIVDPAVGANKLSAYRPGGWGGDGLDDLYNIGGTGGSNQLIAGLKIGAATVTFDLACSVTLDGDPVPLAGLVMADAEQSGGVEYVQAEIPANADWRLIDRTRTAGCSEGGNATRTGQTLRLHGSADVCASGPAGVAFMEGATSAKVAMRGGGVSAIALGVMLFNDFGDAPVSDAGALYSPGFAGPVIPAGTTEIFDLGLSTPTQPATRLGATVDSEGGTQSNPTATGDGADEDAISAPGTVLVTPGTTYTLPGVECTGPGTVAGWIDWNDNGAFNDDGEQSTPASCTGSEVGLAWDVPDNVASGPTYLRLRIAPTAGGVASPTGVTAGGEVEDYALTVLPRGDFADAPNSYDTARSADGAVNLVPDYDPATRTAPLMLGSTVDIEDDGVPGAGASGDDEAETDDEDAVAAPIVATTGTGFSTEVTATNTGDEAATLAGWVDLDGDGSFEDGERSTVTVPAGTTAGTFTLDFAAPSTTDATYARFRLFGGDVADPSATGQAAAGEVEDHPVEVLSPDVELTKTSNAPNNPKPGDVITYTVTLHNTGDGAFTDENPARLVDDLSDVVDDATPNGGAGSTVGDDPTFTDTQLRWSGALGPDDTATITYSVTLTGGGDGSITNVAFSPTTDEDIPTPDCDDPDTTLPCSSTTAELPKLTVVKEADTEELPAAGEDVTYTVKVKNVGPGDYTTDHPATFSDDLSDVLDDADYVTDSATATLGDVERDDNILSWSGVLLSGDEATITYTVTYNPEEDPQLINRACAPEEEAADPDDACDVVAIPGAYMTQTKTSDPEDGSVVAAGDAITYTLTFTNDGSSPGAVDTTDDLTDVIDDADVTAEPSSNGLTVSRTGGEIAISGSVPAGESRTVTYTVQVKDHAVQDDHVVANTLACGPGSPSSCEPRTTEHPVRHLTLTKVSNATSTVDTGDELTYKLELVNDGGSDFTAESPAEMTDDLSDVLDDATFGVVTASVGEAERVDDELTWSGALAAGESVKIEYTVTLTNLGNHSLLNTAAISDCIDDVCSQPPAVTTDLPHVTAAKTSDHEGSDVSAGDDITYTLTWHNDGEAEGVVDSTDDLSKVLDDAEVTEGPSSSSPDVTAAISDDELRVEGPIAAGDTVTVTYTVSVLSDGDRGDNTITNTLNPDTPQVTCDGDDCEPVDPPTTTHLIGELVDSKAVDPADGTTVVTGQEITYTLTFHNAGTADVEVDREDVYSEVIDDAEPVVPPEASDPALSVSTPADGRFRITGTLAPLQTVNVTYTVRVLGPEERGDSVLSNFLVDTGDEPSAACGDAVSDCTVNPVSEVAVTKTVDPAEGAVDPGDRLDYTLAFTNEGTAGGAIDHVDHLADVLDDADLVGSPESSSAEVAAELDGSDLKISGAIGAGDTVTVTYTVEVEKRSDLGNGDLANFVGVSGDPVPTSCAPDSEMCTANGVSDGGAGAGDGGDGQLPDTGGPAGPWTLPLAGLMALAGYVLIRGGRRKSTVEAR